MPLNELASRRARTTSPAGRVSDRARPSRPSASAKTPAVQGDASYRPMIDGRPVTSREARPSVLAADLRVALLRSARRIRSQHNSASVTEGQYSVICALFEHGELTPGELAEREKVQPPSMTRTVSALVEAGFVKREPHPTDRRQVMVSLTDKGTTEVKETKRRRTEWLAKQLAELTPQERETMAAATHLLRRLTLQ